MAKAKQENKATLKINDVEYNVDDLSDEAKGQLQGLQVAEAQMKRLNVELALIQTARNAYMQALQVALPEKK